VVRPEGAGHSPLIWIKKNHRCALARRELDPGQTVRVAPGLQWWRGQVARPLQPSMTFQSQLAALPPFTPGAAPSPAPAVAVAFFPSGINRRT